MQDYVTGTDKLIPTGLSRTFDFGLARHGFLGSLARYLMIRDGIRRFIFKGCSDEERIFRRQLAKKFNLIHQKIPCAHSRFQFYLLAEYILNLREEWPIVQCGCFKGGSTAKLSLLVKRVNRRLYVCDSFMGIPKPKSQDELFLLGHAYAPSLALAVGEYKSSLQEVQENVMRYGSLENCTFVPGLFGESLAGLDIKPALVFIDVDLVSSALDCLKYLWPKLINNGYWFTHEAKYPQYIEGILDAMWWHEILAEAPPVVYGAGSGLSSLCEDLAYFRKKRE